MAETMSRKECIKSQTACGFGIVANPSANGSKPMREIANQSQVNVHSATIDKIALEKNVDARLVKAIMYMETTHGYYDIILSWADKNKSILPMNINADYWGDTFGTRADLKDPEKNIRAGTEMLYRIMANLPPNTEIEKIATLYNNIDATKVNDYGARVKKIYDEQPWLK